MQTTRDSHLSAEPFLRVIDEDLRNPSLSISPSSVKSALSALARFKARGIELEIPVELAQEIVNGNLFRDGGIIRDAGGKIRGFLKDPSKAGKLIKGPALAFAVIDLAQTVLLNEKLKEIQNQLQSVENKIDALIYSKLHSAFEEAGQISLLKVASERNKRIHSALDSIKEALPAVTKMWESTSSRLACEAGKAYPNHAAFMGSRSKNRNKFLETANELRGQMQLQVSLNSLKAKLYEELGEHKAAQHARDQITTNILSWSEIFENSLGQGSTIRPINNRATLFTRFNLFSGESVDYEKQQLRRATPCLIMLDRM